jgi:tellurite resistance protein
MREAVAHYRQWKKDQPEADDEIETEAVAVAGSYEEAEEAAFSETVRTWTGWRPTTSRT